VAVAGSRQQQQQAGFSMCVISSRLPGWHMQQA
jgi:hypothetical protein